MCWNVWGKYYERICIKMRVLVVDDISDYRFQARDVLQSLGCDVEMAEDGVEAWQKLNEGAFDMVVSDWQMPNMDGVELMAKVRQKLPYITFMLLTTAPNADTVRDAAEKYKPDAVLGKPASQHVDLFKIYVKSV